MFRSISMGVVSFLLVSMLCSEAVAEDYPNLEGRWQIVTLSQDEKSASAELLKGAYVDISDDLIVFHLPSKPDYPDLHMKYQFVPEGIDLKISDSRELDYSGSTFYGKWNLKDERFRFALFDAEDVQARPPVAPAKSVIYFELKREPSKP